MNCVLLNWATKLYSHHRWHESSPGPTCWTTQWSVLSDCTYHAENLLRPLPVWGGSSCNRWTPIHFRKWHISTIPRTRNGLSLCLVSRSSVCITTYWDNILALTWMATTKSLFFEADCKRKCPARARAIASICIRERSLVRPMSLQKWGTESHIHKRWPSSHFWVWFPVDILRWSGVRKNRKTPWFLTAELLVMKTLNINQYLLFAPEAAKAIAGDERGLDEVNSEVPGTERWRNMANRRDILIKTPKVIERCKFLRLSWSSHKDTVKLRLISWKSCDCVTSSVAWNDPASVSGKCCDQQGKLHTLYTRGCASASWMSLNAEGKAWISVAREPPCRFVHTSVSSVPISTITCRQLNKVLWSCLNLTMRLRSYQHKSFRTLVILTIWQFDD